MDQKKLDKELGQKCSHRLSNETDPVERFKCYALQQGCGAIKTIGRKFRIMDDNRDRKLSVDEFIVGCRECRIAKMTSEELNEVFRRFDKDGTGTLDFEEFLLALRPKMNEFRRKLVKKAFAKMDKTGDGIITADDLVGTYDVRSHPRYQNGELTKKQVYQEFLDNFVVGDNDDGVITMAEWIDYYSGVSASIDEDVYFGLVMYNSWGVKSAD